MSRRLREIARDTLAIVDAGGYRTADGGRVDLADQIRAAVAGTRLYRPEDPVPPPPARGDLPVVEVTGESTLAVTRRLAEEGRARRRSFRV